MPTPKSSTWSIPRVEEGKRLFRQEFAAGDRCAMCDGVRVFIQAGDGGSPVRCSGTNPARPPRQGILDISHSLRQTGRDSGRNRHAGLRRVAAFTVMAIPCVGGEWPCSELRRITGRSSLFKTHVNWDIFSSSRSCAICICRNMARRQLLLGRYCGAKPAFCTSNCGPRNQKRSSPPGRC